MHAIRIARQLIAITVTTAAVWTASAQRAEACRCLPPTVESSYNGSSDVVRARVLSRVNAGGTTWYRARVVRTFKGCLAPKQLVLLSTPTSSATCGAMLAVGAEYLINGDSAGALLGVPRLTINSCDYNRRASELSAHDREFLAGRTVCCGDRCTCADGSQPVQCFVDPCQVAPACDEGECVANYCGGCNAEFYDDAGYAVCEAEPAGECASDRDCQATGCSGQVCAPEPVITTCEFRPEYACFQDPAITSCGCDAGRCTWDPTAELAACIEKAQGGM